MLQPRPVPGRTSSVALLACCSGERAGETSAAADAGGCGSPGYLLVEGVEGQAGEIRVGRCVLGAGCHLHGARNGSEAGRGIESGRGRAASHASGWPGAELGPPLSRLTPLRTSAWSHCDSLLEGDCSCCSWSGPDGIPKDSGDFRWEQSVSAGPAFRRRLLNPIFAGTVHFDGTRIGLAPRCYSVSRLKRSLSVVAVGARGAAPLQAQAVESVAAGLHPSLDSQVESRSSLVSLAVLQSGASSVLDSRARPQLAHTIFAPPAAAPWRPAPDTSFRAPLSTAEISEGNLSWSPHPTL